MLDHADVRHNALRLVAGEDGRPGVTLLLGKIPKGRVFARPKLLDLVGMALGLLQTQNVWFFRVEIFEKVLFEDGAEAVDIPGYQFHGDNLCQIGV